MPTNKIKQIRIIRVIIIKININKRKIKNKKREREMMNPAHCIILEFEQCYLTHDLEKCISLINYKIRWIKGCAECSWTWKICKILHNFIYFTCIFIKLFYFHTIKSIIWLFFFLFFRLVGSSKSVLAHILH